MKWVIVATLGLFLVISLVMVLASRDNNSNSAEEKLVNVTGQPTLGTGAVQVVEFGDYKCPACRSWTEFIYPELKKDYIDTNKISFSYINVLFHGDESRLASSAGEAVYKQNPDAFWAFHDELFANQPEQAQHDEVWVKEDLLVQLAKETVPNFDEATFKTNLGATDVQDAVNKDDALVAEHRVELTPSLIVNGKEVENPMDYEQVKKAIDEALGE